MNATAKHQPIPLTHYIMIWAGLLVLTALTITVASLHLGGFSVLAAIVIATVKGSLVLFYFMHLKHEDRVFKIMLCLALFTLAVIMVLTFLDVLLR
jgi:cytochrome c oxidase subunit IV